MSFRYFQSGAVEQIGDHFYGSAFALPDRTLFPTCVGNRINDSLLKAVNIKQLRFGRIS